MIHPTAVIHPQARMGADVQIGPFAVIDEHVEIGDRTEVGPHVYLTGQTRIGPGNKIHAGCVIGDRPQDIRFQGELTGVIIGAENVFREHVTIHRSNKESEPTTIGSHCFLMANSHVGHNTRVGDHVIIANGALLGGHVTVEDRAFISGNCLVHQFVRIGAFALMQGGAGISKDLPPYTIARGDNGMSGLNVIGLRRAGFSNDERLELRRLYHLLFRSGLSLRSLLTRAAEEFRSPKARVLIDFVSTGQRGFCSDRGQADHSSEAES